MWRRENAKGLIMASWKRRQVYELWIVGDICVLIVAVSARTVSRF